MKKGKAGLGITLTAILLAIMIAVGCVVNTYSEQISYYAFDFLGEIGVAVCDTPAGQYQFYGKVRHQDGRVWGRKSGEQFPFDPGVLTDDDGRDCGNCALPSSSCGAPEAAGSAAVGAPLP